MSWWMFAFPIVAAGAGWLIHSIALNYVVQKLLPVKISTMADSVGAYVAKQFSFSELEEKIAGGDGIKKLMPIIEAHIDNFLRNKLSKSLPIISMFIGEKTINQLKEVFMKELEEIFPGTMQAYFQNIQADFNIQEMVATKVKAIDVAQLQQTIKTSLATELRQFKLLGALTGFIVSLLLIISVLIINTIQ